MPWEGLVAIIGLRYPKAGGERKPYSLETTLRIHLLQNLPLGDDKLIGASLDTHDLRRV